MGLFGNKKDDYEKKARRLEQEAITAILSAQMEITGEIRFQGKTRIDGRVQGNIEGQHLVLSKTGRVEGDLVLESLVCHGQVHGNIRADLVTAHRIRRRVRPQIRKS